MEETMSSSSTITNHEVLPTVVATNSNSNHRVMVPAQQPQRLASGRPGSDLSGSARNAAPAKQPQRVASTRPDYYHNGSRNATGTSSSSPHNNNNNSYGRNDAWKDYIENNPDFGIITLACYHKDVDPGRQLFIQTLLLLTILAQFVIPIGLLFSYQTSFQALGQTGCPGWHDDTPWGPINTTTLGVCFVYLSRLCLFGIKKLQDGIANGLNKDDMYIKSLHYMLGPTMMPTEEEEEEENESSGNRDGTDTDDNNNIDVLEGPKGGKLQIPMNIDRFMETGYGIFVYLLNLFVVFFSESPQDVILNALAMEFVLELDDKLKEYYLASFPIKAEIFEAANRENAITRREWTGVAVLKWIGVYMLLWGPLGMLGYAVYLPMCKESFE